MMMPPEGSDGAAQSSAGDPLAAAHASMLTDAQLQFQFAEFTQPTPPSWLEPVARALAAIAPFLQYVFWAGVAIIVAIILYALITAILRRMPSRKKDVAAPVAAKPEYRPTAARARALLEEADRLAAEGHYGEAARVLLHRSIEDFENAFSMAIGPALTSREILRLEPLSPQGRTVFSGIAQAVETSLFGGQPLEAARFAQCREAYASFALKGARR